MSNSSLFLAAQNPTLLDKKHRLATLVVMDAPKRVMHDGVQETLAKLRSRYWLVQGRLFIRKLIHGCIVCRKLERNHCNHLFLSIMSARPFQTAGVDFAGPLHVRASDHAGTSKVWLCLYTCFVTRAVHLDLFTRLTATTFMRSFRRFTARPARRGIPSRMISDNAKTFKFAAAIIKDTLKSPESTRFFTKLLVEWNFNLEKAREEYLSA